MVTDSSVYLSIPLPPKCTQTLRWTVGWLINVDLFERNPWSCSKSQQWPRERSDCVSLLGGQGHFTEGEWSITQEHMYEFCGWIHAGGGLLGEPREGIRNIRKGQEEAKQQYNFRWTPWLRQNSDPMGSSGAWITPEFGLLEAKSWTLVVPHQPVTGYGLPWWKSQESWYRQNFYRAILWGSEVLVWAFSSRAWRIWKKAARCGGRIAHG